jgi:hypothetical protein
MLPPSSGSKIRHANNEKEADSKLRLYLVVWQKFPDVSEEHTASIFRAKLC